MEKTKLLILRITDRCNLACKYCYAHMGMTGDMSLEIARKAVDLLAKPGGKIKIQFTGGEPLLCMELIEDIFRYGREMGIQMSFAVQTNGTLLDTDACALLKQLRCGIGVSLDGIGEANGLRVYPDGRPAFEDTISGIRNLLQAGISCNINTVVTWVNQTRLKELPELAAYLGNVKGIGLDMFRPLGRGKGKEFAPYKESLVEDIESLLHKRKDLENLGVSVKIKELEKVRCMLENGIEESSYCYAQTGDSVAVDPRGDIYPCASFVGMQDMCIGNVASCSLDALYTEQTPKVPGMDAFCQNCNIKTLCRGGCPAGRVACISCGGRNESDCMMHRTIIEYGREEYAKNIMPN